MLPTGGETLAAAFYVFFPTISTIYIFLRLFGIKTIKALDDFCDSLNIWRVLGTIIIFDIVIYTIVMLFSLLI